MMGGTFLGLAFGAWLRIAAVVAAITFAIYVLHRIDKAIEEHYVAPWRVKVQALNDTIAIQQKTIKGQSDSLIAAEAAGKACSDGVASIEAESEIHADAARAAIKDAGLKDAALKIAADSLRKIAAGQPLANACAAAKQIGSDYAREVPRGP